MKNFDFYNPTRIIFGEGRIAELDQWVPADAKVMVLFGGIEPNLTFASL